MNYNNDDHDDDENAKMMAKMIKCGMDGTVMKSKFYNSLVSANSLCMTDVFGINFNITVTMARHWRRRFSFGVFNAAPTKSEMVLFHVQYCTNKGDLPSPRMRFSFQGPQHWSSIGENIDWPQQPPMWLSFLEAKHWPNKDGRGSCSRTSTLAQ